MIQANIKLGKITPRKLQFEFADTLPLDWYQGNPAILRLCNVISLTFPAGEQFFIDSVKYYQGQITDLNLKAAMAGFIGQEALHRKQHGRCNQVLITKDSGLAKFEKIPGRVLNLVRYLPHRTQLAVTCALEHFTALFAHQLLVTPSFKNNAHPVFGRLWIWHAIEESEHKGVCFDVYQAVAGGILGYLERCLIMITTSLVFLVMISLGFCLSSAPKAAPSVGVKPKAQAKQKLGSGLWKMFFGQEGLVREIIWPYLIYFMPNFHPWQLDNTELVERWKREYEDGLFLQPSIEA